MVIINLDWLNPSEAGQPMTRGFAFLAAATATSPKTRSHYHPTRHISNPPKSMPLFLLFFIDTERALTGLAGL